MSDPGAEGPGATVADPKSAVATPPARAAERSTGGAARGGVLARLGQRQARLHAVSIAWQLARLDLLRRYTSTMLGMLWAILSPLCMAAIIGTVFGKLFRVELQTFLPYLFLNLTFWAFFVACLDGGAISFIAAEGYIKQIARVPLLAYPLRMVMAAFVTLLLGLFAVVLVVLLFGGRPTPGWAWVLPGLAAWFLFGTALATLSGIANTWMRDLSYIQTVGVQALFYATPIMFPSSLLVSHGLQPLLTWNPLYHLLILVQVPLLFGNRPPVEHYVAVALSLALVLGLAFAGLRFVRRRLVFWL
ncbi:MAG: ABC transporter permease [Alphaproteobacteria bacterium]